jgi:hypothetical protein
VQESFARVSEAGIGSGGQKHLGLLLDHRGALPLSCFFEV